jgi:hypothetical protein
MELDDIPQILSQDGGWLPELNVFLGTLGLYGISLLVDDDWKPTGYHLIGGKVKGGEVPHFVVGKDGEMVHDPLPSAPGLEKPEYYLVFVVIDPSVCGD